MRPSVRDVLRTGGTLLIAAACAAWAALAGAATASAASERSAATTPSSSTERTAAATSSAASERAAPAFAIVVRDQTALRAAPHEAAQAQALLWQGETVEVRGERLDHLQVWDHRRERGGYVDARSVRRLSFAADGATELLTLMRFFRDTPGAEALGIGLAAAYVKAAPAADVGGAGGAEAFDALGAMAERLAQRASASPGSAAGLAPLGGGAAIASATSATPSRADAALAAHLEVAARYGVRFESFERDGAVRICADGEACGRVLLSRGATPVQQARAVLGLTRADCIDPAMPAIERQRLDEKRAELIERIDPALLPAGWRNRLAVRRAGVWSALAFQRARRGETAPAGAAAQRALDELGRVVRDELGDDDVAAWHDAAIRVGASRWAAALRVQRGAAQKLRIAVEPGEPGQTCVRLLDASSAAATAKSAVDADRPAGVVAGAGAKASGERVLARRCTYGVVWVESATVAREGHAVALAVQPMEAWRELWLFSRDAGGAWRLDVVPPLATAPELGYVEFAGWVPGGKQLLLAREARSAKGALKRNFEVVRLDSLAVERQAGDASVLGAFQRWQDAGWKRETVSLR